MQTIQKAAKVKILGSIAFIVILAAAIFPVIKISVGIICAIAVAVFCFVSYREKQKRPVEMDADKFISLFVAVIGLISLIFAAFLLMAFLTILMEVCFGPWEVWIFSFNLTPVILWLMENKLLIVGLVVFAIIYYLVCNKIDKNIINPT